MISHAHGCQREKFLVVVVLIVAAAGLICSHSVDTTIKDDV